MAIDDEAEKIDATCLHHWKLGSPNGRTSMGVCQRCGAEREFSATDTTGGWSRSPRRAAQRAARPPGSD